VAAIDGTLALLAAIGAEGLPGGHAGVASGPVVQRDGDVFGRTVNLAARLADAATDGVLLVPSTLAVTLPDALFATTPAGTAHLHGVGDLEVSTVRRAEPSRAEGAS
jgi:adenylate cyclase